MLDICKMNCSRRVKRLNFSMSPNALPRYARSAPLWPGIASSQKLALPGLRLNGGGVNFSLALFRLGDRRKSQHRMQLIATTPDLPISLGSLQPPFAL